MKKYIVELTTNENYCTENWDNGWCPEGFIEANDAEEALDLAKDYLRDNGEDVDTFLFRVAEKDEYGHGEWRWM